jgi:DNA-binding LacI/PurR family transcriptional regulator
VKRQRKKKSNSIDMAEVARRAGVSLSTVSRSLAGHPSISDETRERVREIAASINYRVDSSASTLRTGLTRTIAVVIPLEHASKQRLSDPFFLEMLGAIADELTARGYSMLLSKTTQDPRSWISSIVQSRRVDGVIVIGQSFHHAHLNELATGNINMVVWGAQLPDQRYPTVGSDNKEAGSMGTQHLLDQGCRQIVFLGDPDVPEVSARREGYSLALRKAGIERQPRLEAAVRFGSDAAYETVCSLLSAHADFDGIFACSDVIAMSAMRALTERGRKVPSDVAIVGFDDVPLAAYTTPPLTTIRQDYATGARLLVERILQPRSFGASIASVLPTELVVRASSLKEHHRPDRPHSGHKRRETARDKPGRGVVPQGTAPAGKS